MTPLTRNRLIGGAVVTLAAMLFIPAILTPENTSVKSPEPSIDIQADKPSVKTKDEGNTTETKETAIALTSIDNDKTVAAPPRPGDAKTMSQDAPKEKKNTEVTIQLESFADNTEKKVVSQPITQANVIPTTDQVTNWVRVGSFADLKNANKLAADLGANGFKTSVKTITVSGKNYHRVLIGPFVKEGNMNKVIRKLKAEGFTPSIQH